RDLLAWSYPDDYAPVLVGHRFHEGEFVDFSGGERPFDMVFASVTSVLREGAQWRGRYTALGGGERGPGGGGPGTRRGGERGGPGAGGAWSRSTSASARPRRPTASSGPSARAPASSGPRSGWEPPV